MMILVKRAYKQQFRNKNSTGSEISAVILQTNTIRHGSLQRNKINKSVILTVEEFKSLSFILYSRLSWSVLVL